MILQHRVMQGPISLEMFWIFVFLKTNVSFFVFVSQKNPQRAKKIKARPFSQKETKGAWSSAGTHTRHVW